MTHPLLRAPLKEVSRGPFTAEDKTVLPEIPSPADLAKAAVRGVDEFMIGVPTPFELIKGLCAEFAAHVKHTREQQEAFQAHLQDLGIQRLERMTTAEVFETFHMSQP